MKQKKKVVCLGDSLTYGYPYGPHASWVHYVSQIITDLDLVNAGINGNTIEDMKKRFEKDVKAREPDAVMILGGTNDAFSGDISLAATIYSLEEIFKIAFKNRIEPILGLPVPVDDPIVGSKLDKICSSFKEIAANYTVALLNFASSFRNVTGQLKEELYLDGVHPNRVGYEVMGKTAANFFHGHFLKY